MTWWCGPTGCSATSRSASTAGCPTRPPVREPPRRSELLPPSSSPPAGPRREADVRRRETGLPERLAALREAVELAEGRLEVPEVARARALLAKAGARTALGDATVVALAGATGSGKSTLFNALSGSEVSVPGVRRPTTGVAHATVWGDEGADRLLDWLEVPRRYRHEPESALDGLVLLDLH